MERMEWVKERIPPEESILFKRVYKDKAILSQHISKVTDNNGVVFVFKFPEHYPSLDEVRFTMLVLNRILDECEDSIKEQLPHGFERRVVRILYGDWISEVAIILKHIGLELVKMIAEKFIEKFIEKFVEKFAEKIAEKKKKGKELFIENIEELEIYYPGEIIIKYRRITKKK